MMKKRRFLTFLIGGAMTFMIGTALLFDAQPEPVSTSGHLVTFTFTNDEQDFVLTTDDTGRVPLPKSSHDQATGYDFIYRQNRVLSSWFSDMTMTNEVNLTTTVFSADTTLFASWLFSIPGSPQYGDVDAFEADLTTYGHETSIIPARSEAYITLDIWLAPNENILSYRWQMRKDDGVDTFQDIAGASTKRLDIIQEGKYRYRCFYRYSIDGGLTIYELKSHAVTLIRAENNPSLWWLLPVGFALGFSGGLMYILFFKKYALILHYRDNQSITMWVKPNTLYEDIHLPILTKPDEQFDGWAMDREGHQKFDEPMMPRKTIHLYPIWKKAQKG